jgi:hypothetical protein
VLTYKSHETIFVSYVIDVGSGKFVDIFTQKSTFDVRASYINIIYVMDFLIFLLLIILLLYQNDEYMRRESKIN